MWVFSFISFKITLKSKLSQNYLTARLYLIKHILKKKWHVDPKRFAIPGIVPSRHGGTLNGRRAASPLVRLVEGEEKWEYPDHPQTCLNWDETELQRYIACMVLKATANDRRHLALSHDEFNGL
ncbi:uncharacterized protein TNCV_4995881 [Trichonephila clavipes]|nr:uncharacterized protein TNCV_4995881 [Trichonephila clavipes]